MRKAQKRSEISVEDQDFDPTQSFKGIEKEVDPFDTSAAGAVIPGTCLNNLTKYLSKSFQRYYFKESCFMSFAELAEKEEEKPAPVTDQPAAIEHAESIDSDDFDPRAF